MGRGRNGKPVIEELRVLFPGGEIWISTSKLDAENRELAAAVHVTADGKRFAGEPETSIHVSRVQLDPLSLNVDVRRKSAKKKGAS